MFHIIFLGVWFLVSIFVVLIIEENKIKIGYLPKVQETLNLFLALAVAGFVVYLPLLGIYYLIWGL
jgi:hypothetical protein